MNASSPLVRTEWLQAHLSERDVRVVDASWYLPDAGREPAAEFKAAHIPGAVYFDLDHIAQKDTALPHMVAPVHAFETQAGALGLSNKDTIVVYDSAGLLSAARVWWNFRIMGAKNCFVLSGGLPEWTNEKRPLESGVTNPAVAQFTARFDTEAVVGVDEMKQLVGESASPAEMQIVDVRPAKRFLGLQEEPRPSLKSGKMPGSLNLPFSDLIAKGKLLDKEALTKTLWDAGIVAHQPIISSCGSGVTAPLLNLALAELGIHSMRVYDGSWAEWGARADCPVITAKGSDGA